MLVREPFWPVHFTPLYTWRQLREAIVFPACHWPLLVAALSAGGGTDALRASPEAPVGWRLLPAVASLSLPHPGQGHDLWLQPCFPEAFLQGTHLLYITSVHRLVSGGRVPLNIRSVCVQGHAGMSRGAVSGSGQLHLSWGCQFLRAGPRDRYWGLTGKADRCLRCHWADLTSQGVEHSHKA